MRAFYILVFTCVCFLFSWKTAPPFPSLPFPTTCVCFLLSARLFVSCLFPLLSRRSSLSCFPVLLHFFFFQCKHNLESALGDSSMTKASPEYVKVSGRKRNGRNRTPPHFHGMASPSRDISFFCWPLSTTNQNIIKRRYNSSMLPACAPFEE